MRSPGGSREINGCTAHFGVDFARTRARVAQRDAPAASACWASQCVKLLLDFAVDAPARPHHAHGAAFSHRATRRQPPGAVAEAVHDGCPLGAPRGLAVPTRGALDSATLARRERGDAAPEGGQKHASDRLRSIRCSPCASRRGPSVPTWTRSRLRARSGPGLRSSGNWCSPRSRVGSSDTDTSWRRSGSPPGEGPGCHTGSTTPRGIPTRRGCLRRGPISGGSRSRWDTPVFSRLRIPTATCCRTATGQPRGALDRFLERPL
jgi:hypothetical protein